MATEKRVDKIIQRIQQDAEEQANQIISEAEEKAKKTKKEAKNKAEKRKQKIKEKGTREAKRERERIVSSANLEGRKKKLEAREELIEEVIEGVKEKFKDLKEEEYKEFIKKQIKTAITEISSKKILVTADAQGKQILKENISEIEEEIKQSKDNEIDIEITDQELEEKGIKISREDGSATIDKTLVNEIKRNRNEYRKKINEILFE